MAMSTSNNKVPSLPSDEDIALARESGRRLAAIIGKGDQAQLCLYDGDEKIVLPMAAMRTLAELLTQMAQGNAFSLVPIGYTLTTQQAADLLNVSRPYFVKLLGNGEIPFTRVGRHRRIKYEDLVAYMAKRDADSEEAMAALAQQAQELGLGY